MGTVNKVHDETKAQRAIAMRQKGWKLRQIAAELDCSLASVSILLRNSGFPAREHSPLREKSFQDDVVSLYEGGMSLQEVGARLGCAHATILNILHNRGVSRRPQGPQKVTSSQQEAIANLYLQGKKISDIGEKLGCSAFTVSRHLKKLDLLREGKRHRNRLLKKEWIGQIVGRFRKGVAIQELSNDFAMSPSLIACLLKARGLLDEGSRRERIRKDQMSAGKESRARGQEKVGESKGKYSPKKKRKVSARKSAKSAGSRRPNRSRPGTRKSRSR